MKRLRLSLFVAVLLLAGAFAQTAPPSQIELNGFLLRQYLAAPDAAFGKPTQVTTSDDGWTYRVYVFDQQHNGYMAFKYPSDDEKRMLSIQIAGDAGTPMRAFLGLLLGDDKKKVIQALGKPDKIEPEEDHPFDLYTYKDRNYSLEINRQGKLSSIQLMGFTGFARKPNPDYPKVETLKDSLLAKDIEGLLLELAGDLEIYRGDQIYNFNRSARSELSDQKSEIWKLLLGEKESVRAAFASEPFEPDQQIRVYEKASPGSVAKFPHSKIIEEIVYKVEAGTWKVWEISLR